MLAGYKQWGIQFFRILGLAGSLRRVCLHRGVVRVAHEVAPEWMNWMTIASWATKKRLVIVR